jgi:methionyl-tRNA formyltransferase
MRVIILTADQLRHKYFACRLMESFDVTAVFCEKKAPKISAKRIDNNDEFLNWHFNELRKTEEVFFKDFVSKKMPLHSDKVRYLDDKNLNHPDVIEEIKRLKPDCAAVLGTCILKDEIIDAIPKIINLHLGLSPYYRGSGTNFWPLYNKELEYIGVTIHFLDKGIDSGEIIRQRRPKIEVDDNIHTLGCKAIVSGADAMIEIISALAQNKIIKSYPQKPGGQLYLKKDFTREKLETAYGYIKSGLIKDYAASGNKKKVEIIE